VTQAFFPNEQRFYPIYEACEELGPVVVMHSGTGGDRVGAVGRCPVADAHHSMPSAESSRFRRPDLRAGAGKPPDPNLYCFMRNRSLAFSPRMRRLACSLRNGRS